MARRCSKCDALAARQPAITTAGSVEHDTCHACSPAGVKVIVGMAEYEPRDVAPPPKPELSEATLRQREQNAAQHKAALARVKAAGWRLEGGTWRQPATA